MIKALLFHLDKHPNLIGNYKMEKIYQIKKILEFKNMTRHREFLKEPQIGKIIRFKILNRKNLNYILMEIFK